MDTHDEVWVTCVEGETFKKGVWITNQTLIKNYQKKFPNNSSHMGGGNVIHMPAKVANGHTLWLKPEQFKYEFCSNRWLYKDPNGEYVLIIQAGNIT